MDKYFRRIILKSHFKSGDPPTYEGFINTSNSNWTPKNIHHSVKTYIQAVSNEFTTTINKQHTQHPDQNHNHKPTKNQHNHQNLSKGELAALESLKLREDIVISKADKGGAVVVQSTDQYIAEANRQLNDKIFYEEQQIDLTPRHKTIVNETIQRFKAEGLISEKAAAALTTEDPRTARFYTLPKVHKDGNPGRPIISAINTATTNIARYVDHHLQPLAEALPSFVKDTGAFLRKVKATRNVPRDAILVTMDVGSLFTNIPHNEGINTVARALERRNNPTIPSRVIIKFLSHVLNLNNFSFNDRHFLQKKGCAMGSKCSGSYADIFMGDFESTHIYPRISEKHRCYTRYKDDIFLIWTDGEESLKNFVEEINLVHPSIKFDVKYSRKRVNFLDTYVYLNKDGTLRTALFTKETDRNAYLHFLSYHPPKQIHNIPYGQFLRTKKICSSDADAAEAMQTLEERFKKRGYPTANTPLLKSKATGVPRDTLLVDKPKEQTSRTPFTTTYNKAHPPIQEIINRHWHILKTHEEIAPTFEEKPVVAFRRNKNLRDLIGNVHLSRGKKIVKTRRPRNKVNYGCKACLTTTRNQCCRHIVSTKKFKSDVTGEELDILHDLNCKSRNCIYLGYCILCKKSQYVGKSEPPANLRINTHRHDVTSTTGCPFDKHFALPGHDFNAHARFVLIEQINDKSLSKADTRRLLEDREDYWMLRLKTLQPDGQNDHLNAALRNRIHDICS